jgi:sugar phosphate isomerase/epimerase
MFKFSICNETFQGWEWEPTCQKVAELGYDGIEMAPFTLAEDARTLTAADRSKIRTTAERAGLEIVGLHWLLVSPKGLSLTGRDEAVRAETGRYLASLVDFCADLGGKIMVLGSPAQRRIPEGDTTEQAAYRFLTTLSPAIARCEQHGITLCLEPLPPPEPTSC